MRALFLDGGRGRLFCIEYAADVGGSPLGVVVVLPPFAEEMNRCRKFSSTLARDLSRAGYTCVQVDLFGTGDSEGEFKDATWPLWCLDVEAVCAYARSLHERVHVVSVRGGSLLLRSLLDNDACAVEKICMVEPFLSGAELMSEFLRIRVARSMFEGKRESATSLSEALADGELLEVGGYELSSELHAGIMAQSLDDARFTDRHGIVFGCGSADGTKHLAELEAAVSGWRENGFDIDYRYEKTEPFWTKELPENPQRVIDRIVSFLQ